MRTAVWRQMRGTRPTRGTAQVRARLGGEMSLESEDANGAGKWRCNRRGSTNARTLAVHPDSMRGFESYSQYPATTVYTNLWLCPYDQ